MELTVLLTTLLRTCGQIPLFTLQHYLHCCAKAVVCFGRGSSFTYVPYFKNDWLASRNRSFSYT